MKEHRRHVLLVLGWYDYRLHRGIERFARENGWSLSANMAREHLIPGGWDGDGILAWLGEGDDLAEFVRTAGKPTVDFSLRRPHLRFPRVLEDHTRAAELVAEHFTSRGLRQFMFYSDAPNWSYEERGHGFGEALERRGHACTWIRWHQSPHYCTGRGEWRRRRSWLAAQLRQAPKPLGVFAANDQHALEVLEACEHARFPVPESVAIVGAEDYLLAVDAMRTPVSSVDTNLEAIGYQGAALLNGLMMGRRAPSEPIRVQPAGLIVRKSSDLLACNHPGVVRALKFIHTNALGAIGVEDAAHAASMSRRGLHNAFLQHVGRAPGDEIRRLRIDRAKRLLRESNEKEMTIATQCGYRSLNSFCVAFKKATGLTPHKFRIRPGG